MEIITTEENRALRSQLISEDWFNALAEECDAIYTETIHISRWVKIQGYHMLGQRLLEDMPRFEAVGITQSQAVQCVAQSIGKSKRSMYYAIQFARKFPDINQLPEGKNISWHKICNEVLPEKKHDEKIESLVEVCPECGQKIIG
jgi:hypothetical protein